MKPRNIPTITAAPLLIALAATPLFAQSVWTGGDGDYDIAENWSPEGVPAATDAIEITSGTATKTGTDSNHLGRAADSLLDGGNIVLNRARFLNGFGGPAVFTMNSGSIDQTGTFFIVGQNNFGELIQNGGSITHTTETISGAGRGFFWSDNNASRGIYRLNGGSLVVNYGGNSAASTQVSLGRGPNGDLFHIDGGEATFNATTTDRRFYISRNGVLRMDSGSLTADGFRFFVLGRNWDAARFPVMEINGGDVEIAGLPGDGAFIVSNEGRLLMNGGALTVKDGPVWIGEGGQGGVAATVIQTGGTFTSDDGNLILSRASTRSGQYFMRGGTLEVPDITTGAGVNPRFYYQGGTVTLTGDRTGIVDEPFFISFGAVDADYDELAGTTTLSITPATGTDREYRYYRFTATRLRSGSETGTVQLSEFAFLNDGAPVDMSAVTVTNPGGDNPLVEPPENLIDGDPTTKWLDNNNAPLVFDFGAPTTIDSYRFTTANDNATRDPVRWTIEGSDDGSDWDLIERVLREDLTPDGRHISTLDIPLPASLAIPVLEWTGNTSGNWDTMTLNWDESGPRAWENASPALTAVFGSSSQKSVTVAEGVTAGILRFDEAGYDIGGAATLTLEPAATLAVVEDATISAPLGGTNGFVKTGDATLTLSGDNTLSGAMRVESGALEIAGGSNANSTLEVATNMNSRALAVIDSPGPHVFPGFLRLGGGADAHGAVVIRSGEVRTGGGNAYIEIGGGFAPADDSWGGLRIEGGSLFTELTPEAESSGIRVGGNGVGVLTQTGGTLNSRRWFAIGRPGGLAGEGVVNLLGGTTIVNPNFRILLGDASGSVGTLNLGTIEGGDAEVITLNPQGLTVGSNGTAQSAILNLNSGTLTLGGPISKNPASSANATVNFNGAKLVAGADGISLVNGSLSSTFLYEGGVTVDTNGNNASFGANLATPSGDGVEPAAGGFETLDGGAGYLGEPLVRVTTDGFGSGLSAIAVVTDGEVEGVLITCPGRGYEAGDELTFEFTGGGATIPAPPLVRVITADDLVPNSEGAFVKTGAGTLELQGNSTYDGDTVVEQGTLAANGFLGNTTLAVDAGATLTGNLDIFGPVVVNGTLAPGAGVGIAQGFDMLTLGAGSTLEIDIANWGEVEGVDHDTMTFGDIEIQATSADKLTVRIVATGLSGFSETDRNFLIADSFGVSGFGADNWELDVVGFPGSGTWDLVEDDGRLFLNYTGDPTAGTDYDAWLAGFPGLSDAAPLADPDNDGIANVLEYVLGGDPTVPGTAVLPAAAEDDGALVFTFVRRTASKATTTQTFQYGNDLVGWTDVVVPAASAGNVVIEDDAPAVGQETVTITVDAAAAADGRLFGRLEVTLD